jgi:hypothetical protein
VPVVPGRFVHESEIDDALLRAQQALGPDVVRVRYSFADDWTGEPSLFFRVLLSDAASESPQLGKIVGRIRWGVEKEVKPDEMGLHAYFNFRSKSEQDDLQDPAWA